MNVFYLDEDLVLNSGYQTSSCYLFASAFTYRHTALLQIHASQEQTEIPTQHSGVVELNRCRDGDHERHYTFMDIGDMCLVRGTQAGDSPHLVRPLLQETIWAQESPPLL